MVVFAIVLTALARCSPDERCPPIPPAELPSGAEPGAVELIPTGIAMTAVWGAGDDRIEQWLDFSELMPFANDLGDCHHPRLSGSRLSSGLARRTGGPPRAHLVGWRMPLHTFSHGEHGLGPGSSLCDSLLKGSKREVR